MKIELTDEQERTVQQGQPVEVTDPQTQRAYLLIARETYERSGNLLGPWPTNGDLVSEVAPGVRRSQEAFWRDLPELLKGKKNRGRWVCYHGDERIGIADSAEPLIRECLRRGLRRDQYDLDIIQPRDQAPWEEEEVEPLGSWHFVEPQA